MQRLHHLLALTDAHGPVIRIGRVRAFRNVVVNRIITPVITIAGGFVYGTIVVQRHQLHRRDAESFQIGDTRRKIGMAVQGSVGIGEGKILAAMGFRKTARRIIAEVSDVRLPHDRLRQRYFRHMVMIPPLGVGAGQVDHHAAPAVHAGRTSPWIRDTIDRSAFTVNQKIVVDAMLVVRKIIDP